MYQGRHIRRKILFFLKHSNTDTFYFPSSSGPSEMLNIVVYIVLTCTVKNMLCVTQSIHIGLYRATVMSD